MDVKSPMDSSPINISPLILSTGNLINLSSLSLNSYLYSLVNGFFNNGIICSPLLSSFLVKSIFMSYFDNIS